MRDKREAARALGGAAGGAGIGQGRVALRHQDMSGRVFCQYPHHGVVAEGVWHKRVRGSLHRLRRPPAWAVDLADLEAAEALGVRLVAIHDQEAERDYWASIGIIRRRGFVLNRGFGEQVALPLAGWRSTRQEAEALEGESKEGEQPASPQLSLGLLS